MHEENLSLSLTNSAEVVTNADSEISVSVMANERLMAIPEERRQEIIDFSKKIDVSDSQVVTSYGNIPLEKSSNVCGKFLEKMAGTVDDKDIVNMIAQLSEATNSGQKEIEILAKKPSIFERARYLLSGKNRDDEMKMVIKSTYDMIMQLKSNMDASLDTLIQRGEDAKVITKSNVEIVHSLEEYLVAGYLALDDAKQKVEQLEGSYSVDDQIKQKAMQSGIRNFEYKLRVLEDSKAATIIAATQSITAVENMNTLHLMIESKSRAIATLFSQIGSNAILNNTSKRIQEGQRTMDQMSKSMLLKVSQDTADTTVSIARSFSEGVMDTDTIVKSMEIMAKGYQEAGQYYKKFSDSYASELKKVKEANDKMLPVLTNLVSSSLLNEEIKSDSSSTPLRIEGGGVTS